MRIIELCHCFLSCFYLFCGREKSSPGISRIEWQSRFLLEVYAERDGVKY